jgi:hypothetical protein
VKVAAIGVVLAALAAVIAFAVLSTRTDKAATPQIALELPAQIAGPDPLRFEPGRAQEYEQAAAFGLSHVLFEKSPGGVLRAAQRTARFRDIVDSAVSGGIDPDMVEAIVLLESAGRQDVIAGDDPENAAGLTQILAETATNFLGMQVDLEASRRLTHLLEDAVRRGDETDAARLRAERQHVDERFDPERAIAGTVRYLTEAKEVFGRDDLAVVSYHMGIGNLAGVVRAYTGGEGPIDSVIRDADIDYARLYFDSSPIVHRAAWEQLASFGDDSQTYYWRVLGALGIMHLFRDDPGRLEQLAELHGDLPSAELVLHPSAQGERYDNAGQLQAAVAGGALVPLRPGDGDRFAIDPRLESVAARLSENPNAYVALRPRAARLLAYVTAKVYELSGDERPLVVTRATYDEEAAPTLTPHDPGDTAHAGVHATGFAFDILRRYGSGAQAAAFQWALDRLEALGLIAWTRGRSVIHVVVSPRADML